MAHFTLTETQAWLEPTKMSPTFSSIDAALEAQVALQVLSKLSQVFDISGWTNDLTTPSLVRSIIAMEYVAAVYDRTYSDDGEVNSYAALLRRTAEANIAGLLAGTVILSEVPDANTAITQPSFFPDDASSANEPSADFPSDGGPAFMMGTVW